MIKVGCPSCSASYDVDEERLPEGGLRMRCPKCSESFQVHRDGSTVKTGGGASPAASKPPRRKSTEMGMGSNAPPRAPAAALPASEVPTPEHEIDLPAAIQPDLTDLPAPKSGGAGFDLDPLSDPIELTDLPSPKKSGSEPPSADFDPFADLDLPAPIETPEDADLPVAIGMGGADLPAPLRSPGGTDLPAPLRSPGGTDLPAPLRRPGGTDLPAPKRGDRSAAGEAVDLPMAVTDAELPQPLAGSRVPDPISLDSELPVSTDHKDLPVTLDDFEGAESARGGGAVEIDLPDGEDIDLEMDLEVEEEAPQPAAREPLGGAMGAKHRGAAADGLGAAAPDDLEESSADLGFPGESEPPDLSGLHGDDDVDVDIKRPPRVPQFATAPSKGKLRLRPISVKRPAWLLKAVAVLGVAALLAGLGYYSGKTKYGFFGIHLVEPLLPGSGDNAAIHQAIAKAEQSASSDTYAATRQALADLAAARSNARLNRLLVARSLLHESYYQVRYGPDTKSAVTADKLRAHLQRRGDDASHIHVALAADALRKGDTATASTEIELARQEDATDSYVDLVAGEIALAGSQGEGAVEAFMRAWRLERTARAQWGIARGRSMLGKATEAAAAAEATLEMSPNHAGARIAVAEQLIEKGKTGKAYDLLQMPAGLAPAEGPKPPVAPTEQSVALAMVGDIEANRGRLGAARKMYEKALGLDAGNTLAAIGAARIVLMEGGYGDALARFQKVLQSEIPPGAPTDATGKPKFIVQAKLGAAQALIAMDNAEQANAVLADLQTPEPVSADVELWLGRVADARGKSKAAVRRFRNAITLRPDAIAAYVALAQHYSDTDRPAQAVAVLLEAQKNVEITAEVRRVLGWAELQRNRVDDAIEQFLAALKLEPKDSAALFGLATAYRRKSMLEEAAVALDKVEELDAEFPGLALEKGRLAEARGQMDVAEASYRAALRESPDDLALKSRLAAVLIMTDKVKQGEAILREVLAAQPYSAEAEHYLGRVDMQRGQWNSARARFARAARLDSDNGMYRMYVAWAQLESNEMRAALRNLDEAIELDPTLGDAYWLRARIRIRAGAVRDALSDLLKAIELNPGRVEAFAAMGECHDQLGQVKQAIQDYEKAVAARPDEAYWWYRLGRLQLDEGRRDPALTSLATAVALADKAPAKNAWLADAHRLKGDIYYAQKKRDQAVVEYSRYLDLADLNAFDRPDVEAKLRKIAQGIF